MKRGIRPAPAATRRARSVSPYVLALLAAAAFTGAGCGEGSTGPRSLRSLEPGQAAVLRAADLSSFRLEAGEGREYAVVIQNAGRTAGSASLELRVAGPSPAAASVAAAVGGAPLPGHTVGEPDLEAVLREAMRDALRRAGARPARAGPHGPALARAARVPPSVGDALRFTLGVRPDLSADCADTTQVIDAVVRAVGSSMALLEDVTTYAPRISGAQWAELLRELEEVVFPVDTAYFGPPADLDGNGRVLALVTPAVNRLTPRGSRTLIAGFFFPGDLADPQSCPAGNRAEILYLLAPDPEGRFSVPRTVEQALRLARGVTAHELQHLLTAQQRISLGSGSFANLEETWLSEGLAHLAEEVVGLKTTGLATRRNVGLQEAAADPAAFSAFSLSNFARLGWHMLSPNRTEALAVQDPTGTATLALRGNAWIFLRWLGDQYGPSGSGSVLSGSDEFRLFRALSRGGPQHLRGIANVEQAVGAVGGRSSWEELMAAFEPSLAVDDAGPIPAPASARILTWNLRDVYAGLSETDLGDEDPFRDAYPLEVTPVPVREGTDARFPFPVNAFTARYFHLTVDEDATLAVRTEGGGRVPATIQATVVRTR